MKRWLAFALIGVAVAGSVHAQTAKTNKKVTYADIQPIFRDKCMACHRPGEIAPMSLLTYEETRPWAKSIRKEIKRKAMPPWHADKETSKIFRNDISLSDEEIDRIVAWVDAGAERGNSANIAPPPRFLEGWQVANILGRPPDVILYMQEEYTIPASGEDINKDFEIPTNFKRDYWVIASEVRGNSRVVHHNTTTVRGPDGARDRTGRLSSAVPGKLFDLFGPESAKLIKAGSTVVFGMHYHPYGKEEKDRSKIGLWLAEIPFVFRMHSSVVADPDLRIPPMNGNFLSVGEYTFEEDSEITAMKPHMHYRGKDMEYKVLFPDGRKEVLLSVPAYDFNWQINYELKQPVFVPKGSKMLVRAHFDNSPTNPWNPDPEAEVLWGSDSSDEMMEGWFDFRRKLDVKVDPEELKLKPGEFDHIIPPSEAGSE
ncbi:MAG: cytochrome c [candidate division Zixibacteria bacterium]|nr:cytochrome c [candidate division Zixibacteria bacterium]